MRWILLCLISFNLIYFGWKQFLVKPEPIEAHGQQIDEQDQSGLVMLKEVLPAAGSAAPPPSIDIAKRFSPKAVELAEASNVSPEPKDAATAVALESKAADPSDDTMGEEVENVEDVASVEYAPAEDESEVMASPPQLETVCARVGPYDVLERVESLAARLQGSGVQANVSKEDVLLYSDNWVLIPSLGSRKEALRILKELQGNKIDSYLVTEGEHANAISLGLFKKASSAQGVLDKMRSAGYEAEIHQLDRRKTQYWAAVMGQFEVGKSEQMLSQLVDDREKIKFSETLCEMFASTP